MGSEAGSLLADLARLLAGQAAEGSSLAAVLRHSARESMGDGREHRHLRLTEEGRRLAFDLGLRLPKGRPIRIFHSPVHRCWETAEEVREGARAAGLDASVAGVKAFLEVPFLDFQRALDLIRPMGVSRFSRLWLDGGVEPGVIKPAEAVFREMTAGVVATVMEDHRPHIDLHIAHDWNIILLREVLLGLRHEEAGWPGFLDGVALLYDGGRLTAAYRGESRTVDWPLRNG